MSGELRAVLSARMLGSLVVTVNGVAVDTSSSRRTRQVLAYLLLHRRAAVSMDVLMDTFWPTASPEAFRNNRHVALNGVRQALRVGSPCSVLQRRPDTYRLDAADDVGGCGRLRPRLRPEGRRADRAGDTATAVGCSAAADPAGSSCDLLADDPYLSWVSLQRESMRLEALQTLRRLSELYAAKGDHTGAVLIARRALGIDPYDEAVHRQLMLSFRDVGQLHLALAQLLRRPSVAGLPGCGPPPQTVRLNEQLRHHKPAVTPAGGPAAGHTA